MRTRELADLLVVVDYVDPSSREIDRRAVLIQAKMLKGGKVRPSGREWLQHELLAWLPTFQFVDRNYDPRPRSLGLTPLVGDPDLTAEYGSIDLYHAEWQQWLPQTSQPPFIAPLNLADFLARMVVGDSTCSRRAIPGGADDWSVTVDELLLVTAAKPIVKAAPKILRGNENVIGLIADTSPWVGEGLTSRGGMFGGGGAGGGEHDFFEELPDGPISTIHITVSGLDDAFDIPESDAAPPPERS